MRSGCSHQCNCAVTGPGRDDITANTSTGKHRQPASTPASLEGQKLDCANFHASVPTTSSLHSCSLEVGDSDAAQQRCLHHAGMLVTPLPSCIGHGAPLQSFGPPLGHLWAIARSHSIRFAVSIVIIMSRATQQIGAQLRPSVFRCCLDRRRRSELNHTCAIGLQGSLRTTWRHKFFETAPWHRNHGGSAQARQCCLGHAVAAACHGMLLPHWHLPLILLLSFGKCMCLLLAPV